MPADTGMEKPTASPIAGAPANASHTPDKPRSASEHRKVNGSGWRRARGRAESSKPIMEKRRRARINESLGQLKMLILDALKKDSSRHSKLEKADILEMTVKHLRNLQRAQMAAALSADPSVLGKYRAGFNECMNEVTRFLSTCEGVNADVRARLLGHLSACLGQIVAMNYLPPPPAGQPAHLAQPLHVQLPPTTTGAVPVPCKLEPTEALSPKVYGGFQLVPATDGQFAFLIPNPTFPPGSGPVIPLYANSNVPVSTSGGSGNSASTPSASPVQGLTSFGHSVVPASQAGSPIAERRESVWRPW
ncbi:transcription factor HES-4 isoform X1 [Lagopus leucura]|uniref:transcription factor HES-4 isoform X1 n=1 Tax=Lagopus leucura TaxID=30410 RepID=UPI001C68354D|nr:transcription factor HES-4 isoform X1 [Lagopus leucura]